MLVHTIASGADPAPDLDRQIGQMRAKIGRAFTAYRAECDDIDSECDIWRRRYLALRDGHGGIFRRMSLASEFSAKCRAFADRLARPLLICQDAAALLAAQMLRADGTVVALDGVEPYGYRVLWDRGGRPSDPLRHALDRATAGLVSFAEIVIATSGAFAAALRETGISAISMPDFPSARPFAVVPGAREACRLGDADRLIVCLSRADRGFRDHLILAALRHLPSSYHILFVADGRHPASERYRRELEQHAGDPEITRRVHVLPAISCAEFPNFAGAADMAVLGLDPAEPADRLALPASLFDCISARLPVAAGDLPEIQQILTAYGIGARFDANEPQSIAASLDDLTRAKPDLLPNLERAARELVWSRNDAALLTLRGGAKAAVLLRSEPPAEDERARCIASTLLDDGVNVMVVTGRRVDEPEDGGRFERRVPGVEYLDVTTGG